MWIAENPHTGFKDIPLSSAFSGVNPFAVELSSQTLPSWHVMEVVLAPVAFQLKFNHHFILLCLHNLQAHSPALAFLPVVLETTRWKNLLSRRASKVAQKAPKGRRGEWCCMFLIPPFPSLSSENSRDSTFRVSFLLDEEALEADSVSQDVLYV